MSLPNLSSPIPAASPSVPVSPDSTQAENESVVSGFLDRRSPSLHESSRPERRQFGSSHAGLSKAGRELALAIDQYKVQQHRRYLTCDEMLTVLSSLGYVKQS